MKLKYYQIYNKVKKPFYVIFYIIFFIVLFACNRTPVETFKDDPCSRENMEKTFEQLDSLEILINARVDESYEPYIEDDVRLDIVTKGECEYVIFREYAYGGTYSGLTHHENCKFCKERNK